MEMPEIETSAKRSVWNAGRNVGAKRALKPKQIWEIRFYLNERRRLRDRALFDLAIESKLRGCDLGRMKIGDIVSGGHARSGSASSKRNVSFGRSRTFNLTIMNDRIWSTLAGLADGLHVGSEIWTLSGWKGSICAFHGGRAMDLQP